MKQPQELNVTKVMEKINQDLNRGGYAQLNLRQLIIQTPYTFVEVSDNFGVQSFGFSKANPNDKWDARLGITKAISRAVKRYVSMHSEPTFDDWGAF